jgi:hypothetical protein
MSCEKAVLHLLRVFAVLLGPALPSHHHLQLTTAAPCRRVAISMACRLRFCRKLNSSLEDGHAGASSEAAGAGSLGSPTALAGSLEHLDLDAMLR